MPVPSSSSPRFPPSVRKTRGKSKKDEAPLYAPPRPVPTMDTVLLASESVAKEQSEPTVFDAGCATCILRDRECEHGTPGTICDHCSKGRVSHCSHTFVVADHTRAANHLEPYTRLSNEPTSSSLTWPLPVLTMSSFREHLFRASTRLAIASNRVGAWIRQTVSSLGPHGLPMMAELPEELRPLWAQLLLDSEAELSVDYRDAIRRYPFISDSRRTDLTTDEDLPILVDFLLRRAARVQQLTPPPKESSGWPYRDEAGPSGSK
ncbi:hypothetical protein B0H14DRAFT_2758354 [Mycena olivaceomarginata]|nr:hypothetical protein B0H14DRAFT_2758354 [Mycena olivaceomarginata]